MDSSQLGAPKTFFIFPNPLLVDDAFLELAFLKGYECYSLQGVLGADHRQIVATLVNAFPHCLLFFFIENDEPVDYYVKLLGAVQKKFADSVSLGVFYKRRSSTQEEQAVQRSFLFEVGIEAGCVPLEETNLTNQGRVLDVLAANEVAGRRKAIRMPDASRFHSRFVHNDQTVEGPILDLSITHFTVQFALPGPPWEFATKIRDITLTLGTMTIEARGLITLKRIQKDKVVFVIRFHSRDVSDEVLMTAVNKIIYRYYQNETMAVLNARIQQVTERG